MNELVRDRAGRSAPTAAVRHGKQKKHTVLRTVLKSVAAALAVVLVSGTSVAAITLYQLNANIDVVDLVGADGESRVLPTVGEWEGGFNVMLVGVDNAEGQKLGGARTATLNDVNILVHVAEDQQSAVAVSIPRDMIVPIPECPREDGQGTHSAMSAQPINAAYSYGGLSCVVLTVEALTGLEIPYGGVISFDGVAQLSTAVGGVEVCVDGPINDPLANLYLPEAGTYELEGYEALAFLRTRYGVGDGSDLGRISSQQVYLSSLIRKVQDEGVLTDVGALYGLATVASEAMQLSSGLARPDTMVSMAQALRNIPTENIVFVQYPGTTGLPGIYQNKVAPLEAEAEALFDKIRNDVPFVLAEGSTGPGAGLDPNAPQPSDSPSASPSASPSDTAEPIESPSPDGGSDGGTDGSIDAGSGPEVLENVPGQTAAQFTCSRAN